MMKHGGLPTEEDYGGYLGQVNYLITFIKYLKYLNIICNKMKESFFLFRMDTVI